MSSHCTSSSIGVWQKISSRGDSGIGRMITRFGCYSMVVMYIFQLTIPVKHLEYKIIEE
jgi:hypothetical protein